MRTCRRERVALEGDRGGDDGPREGDLGGGVESDGCLNPNTTLKVREVVEADVVVVVVPEVSTLTIGEGRR